MTIACAIKALRETTRPQWRGDFVRFYFNGPAEECPVCAAGAILLACVSGTSVSVIGGHALLVLPEQYEAPLSNAVLADIVSWNDRDKLTFAQIADKLEAML